MTRHCYWHPEYIASRPFCNVSYLPEKEARAMAELEEIRLFENLDIIKKQLQQQMQNEAVSELDEVQRNGEFLNVKKVVSDWMAGPKKFYFIGFGFALSSVPKKDQNRFGCSYTQTSDGRPSKIAINRAEFLRK